jgi:protein-disulfide isomerase
LKNLEVTMKKPSLGAAANVALIVAAAIAVWNGTRQPASQRSPEPQPLESWEQEFAAGILIGPEDAPIQIVELMDFQCPFCRAWSARLDSLAAEHPSAVQISFHHWPLPYHEDAIPAAVAAECAHRQGAFQAFARTLFSRQEAIGGESWRAFAAVAGVPDLEAFEACSALPPDSFPRIQYGIDLATKTQARGTPTIWLNGQVARPSLEELRKLAERQGP